MLKGVQMEWHRKATLGGIFCLVVITMIIAIIRVALVGSDNKTQLDATWMYLWSAIETSVAIIVACLATFRNLFSRENGRQPGNKPIQPGPSSFFVRGGGRRVKMSDILDSLASRPDDSHWGHQQQSDDTSDVHSIVENHSQGSHSLYEIPRAA
ncbi:MAG: hypothetical protein Q9221_004794 [Calogaya cf. arnoldii]